MSDLPARVLTAIVLGIVVIGGIYYSYLTFCMVMLIIGFFSSKEYIHLASFGADLVNPQRIKVISSVVAVSPLAIYIILRSGGMQEDVWISLTGGLIAMSGLFFYHLSKNEIGDWKVYQPTALSMVYISLPIMIFTKICGEGPYQWMKPMSILILIWSNDTFAYFTGRFFGKRKLYESVSPKKTIEGFIGGMIFSIMAGLILSVYIRSLTPGLWIAYGFGIAILSTIGDLFESMMKRRYGVKDSGNSLPGHGGFLDRFDAFIFVLPIVTLFLYLCWK